MRTQRYGDIECKSAADGSFNVRKLRQPGGDCTVCQVRRAQSWLESCREADEHAVDHTDFSDGHGEGRLVDAKGQIIANGQVTCGIQIPVGERSDNQVRSCFGSWSRSGPDGRYTLEYLIPGEKYRVDEPYDGKSKFISTLGEVKPLNAEPINMGDTPVKR